MPSEVYAEDIEALLERLEGVAAARVVATGGVVHEDRYVIDPGERIRDVRQGPDGLLYLLTDHPKGRIVRLAPGARPR